MYDKLKKLKITNREVDEENDYLLSSEYAKIEEIIEFYKPLEKVFDLYNTYAKESLEKSNYKNILTHITCSKPDNYSVSKNNFIEFRVNYYHLPSPYRDNSNQYYSYNKYIEQDFKYNFIQETYNLLVECCNKYNFMRIDNGYNFSEKIYVEFTNSFLNDYDAILSSIQTAKELQKYYKDKIINVEQDDSIAKEIQELEDFLKEL